MERTGLSGRRGVSWLILRVAVLSLTIAAAAGPAAAGPAPPPCGEATAPQCGGQCPAGQRCVASPDTFSRIAVTLALLCPDASVAPIQQESQAANGECECAEVRCGGVVLGQDQGCCNGRPFTLGLQGCCKGAIVDAGAPCECNEEAIDLAVAGCCGEQGSEQPFDPALEACCQQPVAAGACSGHLSTISTFNLGFDCCAGPDASSSRFCDGQCAGSECAASGGCCQCEGCLAGPQCVDAGASTVIDGIPIGCAVGCLAESCLDFENVTHLANSMCTEGGSCVPREPVPAATPTSLVVAVGLLVAASGLAFARRRRWWPGS